MANFPWLLLFLLLVLLSHPAAVRNSRCNNIVPGIIEMTYGYDIASLDLFSAESSRGERSSVLEFSCSEKKNWSSPLTKLIYAEPDQVQSINTRSSGLLTQSTQLNSNLEKLKETLGGSLTIGGGFGYGSFSASASYKQAKEKMVKDNESYAETYAYTNVMQINLRDYEDLKLTKGFRNFIDKKLVVPYDQNPAIYDQFIDTYGTHILVQAQFGGKLSQRTFIKNSYIKESNDMEIKAALKAKLGGFINVEGSVNFANSKTNEKFESNSETHHQFFGGYTDQTQKKSVSNWMATVKDNPCIINARLDNIEILIKNDTTKKELEKGKLFRQIKIYFDDLMSTIRQRNSQLKLNDWHKIESIKIKLVNPKTSLIELGAVGKTIKSLFDYYFKKGFNSRQLCKPRSSIGKLEINYDD